MTKKLKGLHAILEDDRVKKSIRWLIVETIMEQTADMLRASDKPESYMIRDMAEHIYNLRESGTVEEWIHEAESYGVYLQDCDEPVHLSFSELEDIMVEYNEKHPRDKPLEAVIVYSQDNFKEEYSEQSRSYLIDSDNKWFQPEMGGRSLYGSCLDGTDQCLRLDSYRWKVEYCYLLKEE